MAKRSATSSGPPCSIWKMCPRPNPRGPSRKVSKMDAPLDAIAPSLDLVQSALQALAKPLISWDGVMDSLKNTADHLSIWEKMNGDLVVIANQLSLLVTMKKISLLVGKKFKIETAPVLANLKDVKANMIETHQTYSDLCAAAIEYLDKNT